MAALLLDENLPRSAGRVRVAEGHDVVFVADHTPAADDRRVLALAREQARVLVTFDADFGEPVFQNGEAPPPAIVYLRLHPIDGTAAGTMAAVALRDAVQGCLVVCTRDARRRRAFPPREAGDGRT
ncbi:MAG: DUF5615 family PIN-like protein [Rubrivivax sp.]|nr:DUF5615 family PIN-like protein [Rubrivivax sp.]